MKNKSVINDEEMLYIIYIKYEMYIYCKIGNGIHSMTAEEKEEVKDVDEITCVPL